jgi:polyketide cyclase/dehydrase/lipid transport protein
VWFEMRKENLEFLHRAPVVHVAEAGVAAARPAVFAALVEPSGWKHWFPSVREVSYTSPAPHGVGTVREANVGGTRWIEEIIAWDEATHWGWTVVRASVPLAVAQVESFELSDGDDGTRVRWTLALEPRLLARLGAPFAAGTISRLFRRAMSNLERHLSARGTHG